MRTRQPARVGSSGLTPLPDTLEPLIVNDAVGEIPEQLRKRLLSVRAFDASGMMVDADVIEGRLLEEMIGRFFANVAKALGFTFIVAASLPE